MTTTFRWLHLTDLHVGMRDEQHLWPQVEQEVLRDLDRVLDQLGGLDVVFFTGDLAFSGQAAQYARFDDIWGAVRAHLRTRNVEPALLAVPGNHDLQRPAADDAEAQRLRGWADDADLRKRFWSPDCAERARVHEAFAGWTAWAGEALDWSRFAEVQCDGLLPGDFAATWAPPGGPRVGVLGLNTAALQLDGGDYEGRLTVHPAQVTALMQGKHGGRLYRWAAAHDACFLLTHHDPSWLDAEGQQALAAEIAPPGRFVAHLCGHRHLQAHTTTIHGGADAKRLHIGRSLFGMEHFGGTLQRLHGYAAGRIEFGANRTMRLWPRADQLKQAGHRRVETDHSFDNLWPDQGTRAEDLGPSPRRPVAATAPLPKLYPHAEKPAPAAPPAPARRVFISYSHDSDAHSLRVLELADRLVRDGIDVVLDQYIDQPDEGWTVWMERAISQADRVLLVCTERYLARWDKDEPDGVGRGVTYEANLARGLFMRDDVHNKRFTPILFGAENARYVPLMLHDWNWVDVSSDAGYRRLLDHLAGKPRAQKPPLGGGSR